MKKPILLALAFLTLTGCGYGLVGRTSSLPEDIEKIHVASLTNRTTRTQVNQILTQAISAEFVRRQRYEVVASLRDADAVLTGSVIAFRVRPLAFGQGSRATEYEVFIGAQMEFKRTDGSDEILWQQPNYQFRETYQADVSEIDFFSREDEAIELVAEKFAQSMVIDLLEGF